MQIAVSTLGTSLDAWAGVPFGMCSQFLVVDAESMDFVVVSIPSEKRDPGQVSLVAIRAIIKQGAEVVITGAIKDICRQALFSLGIEVISGVERVTVREAIELYASGGAEGIESYEAPAHRIAVASHGIGLDARLATKGEPCTSFVLVDPETMSTQTVQVEPADSLQQTSINAVRAAARARATAVIVTEMRPSCCAALRALALIVAVAPGEMTVREAVAMFGRGELETPPFA